MLRVFTRITPSTYSPLSTRTFHSTMSSAANTNQYGQGKSHATNPNASSVPHAVQDAAPKSLEDNLPESTHPTGSEKGKSHATGDSIVPKKLQELVPESVERALPDAIHDTSKKV